MHPLSPPQLHFQTVIARKSNGAAFRSERRRGAALPDVMSEAEVRVPAHPSVMSSLSQAHAQVPADTNCCPPSPAREPRFPLHQTWKRRNSWRKIRHGEGEYVRPTTPAGAARFETWTADDPIHHLLLRLMEVNKHSSSRTTTSKAQMFNPEPYTRT